MKRLKRSAALLMLVLLFSCEEQGLFVYCPDCTEDDPVSTYIEAKLENSTFSGVLVQIYEGNIEDNMLIYSAEVNSSTFNYEVSINKKYTLTATYNISNSVYIAVDSATPKVRYSKDQCDNPCYYVYDKICNLRLKYTK